jgi:hypothetical protein
VSSSRLASVLAIVGGITWIACGVGWTLAHGSTQDPRQHDVLGISAHGFTFLLAAPALAWAGHLVVLLREGDGRRVRLGAGIAAIGMSLVAAGAILQVGVVDPDRYFSHPAVQAGFLFFLFGLFPVGSLGLAVLASVRRGLPTRAAAYGLTALLVPLPIAAFFLSGASDGTLAWDIGIAAMHAAPGVGWLAVGAFAVKEGAALR